MARKAQGMEKKIPVIGAIIAGASLLVAAITILRKLKAAGHLNSCAKSEIG